MKPKRHRETQARISSQKTASGSDASEFARAFDLPQELAEYFFDPKINSVGLGIEPHTEQRLGLHKSERKGTGKVR